MFSIIEYGINTVSYAQKYYWYLFGKPEIVTHVDLELSEYKIEEDDWYDRAGICNCSNPCSCNSSPIMSEDEEK